MARAYLNVTIHEEVFAFFLTAQCAPLWRRVLVFFALAWGPEWLEPRRNVLHVKPWLMRLAGHQPKPEWKWRLYRGLGRWAGVEPWQIVNIGGTVCTRDGRPLQPRAVARQELREGMGDVPLHEKH